MLVSFSAKNYHSYRDGFEFNMIAEDFIEKDFASDDTCIISLCENQPRLLRSSFFYGPNASGKTAFTRALDAFSRVLKGVDCKGVALEAGYPIPHYNPFFTEISSRDKCVRFEIEFIFQEKLYKYALEYNRNVLLHEALSVFYDKLYNNVFSYSDGYRSEINFEEHFFSSYKMDSNEFQPATDARKNHTVFELIATNRDTILSEIYSYLLGIFTIPKEISSSLLSEASEEIKKEKIQDIVSDLMKLADIGIAGINIMNRKVLPEQIPRSMPRASRFVYQDAQKITNNALFPFSFESAGTQTLFILAPMLVHVLRNGGVFVLETAETGLHPEMIFALIRMFHSPYNTKNAQLIMTTHDMSLLARPTMRRDQIWFVEKIESNQFSSRLYSLRGQLEENVPHYGSFDKWYMQSRFNAIPSIDFSKLFSRFSNKR